MRWRQGSMMLEAVLVMPVYVFLVFLIIQSAFVWTARQMTLYAAYCAARAALVYNPKDYSEKDSGVAHKAACMALSWIAFSDKGSSPVKVPTTSGSYDVPCSDDVGNQVRVAVEEQTGGLPAVKATVDFKYPLFIPFGGLVFAFNPKPNGWDVGPKEGGLIASGDAVEEDSRHYLYIRESYTLAKPYKTETFPLAAEEDKPYLGIKGGLAKAIIEPKLPIIQVPYPYDPDPLPILPIPPVDPGHDIPIRDITPKRPW